MTDYQKGVRAAVGIIAGLCALCVLASLSGCLTPTKIHRWESALLGWARKGGQAWTTTSDEQGRFAVEGLPAGALTVEVRMFGFQAVIQQVKAEERTAPSAVAMALRAMRPVMAGAGAAPAAAQMTNGLEAQVTRSLEETPALAVAAPENGEGSEAFLVQGSLSRGLQQQDRPDMMMEFGGMGGPGGGMPGGGMPGGEGGGMMGGGGGMGGMGGGRGGVCKLKAQIINNKLIKCANS